jgi:hypothetical protein
MCKRFRRGRVFDLERVQRSGRCRWMRQSFQGGDQLGEVFGECVGNAVDVDVKRTWINRLRISVMSDHLLACVWALTSGHGLADDLDALLQSRRSSANDAAALRYQFLQRARAGANVPLSDTSAARYPWRSFARGCANRLRGRRNRRYRLATSRRLGTRASSRTL